MLLNFLNLAWCALEKMPTQHSFKNNERKGKREGRGRPLLLDEEVELQVRVYLKGIRENEAIVNTTIGATEGIITIAISSQLMGLIALTKSWSMHLLECMGFVK